ncbi:GntR family transcriptional regulator [Sphingomonas sp. DBB INV C78]|uniref:GntR family transcriptional regulator n=1 Tax=Sphingomonas sp. DBB INV C78 TaxID=3349434 RepID=UPI0036D4228F
MAPDLHGRDHFERAYAALRTRLEHHHYRSGERISISLLASELGLSQTPIREALSRLVGQNLLLDQRGEGYYVPRIDAPQIAGLYGLYQTLLDAGLRTIRCPRDDYPRSLPLAEPDETIAARVAALLQRIVQKAKDPPLAQTAMLVDLRLRPLRNVEQKVFDDLALEADELSGILSSGSRSMVRRAIRLYHQRRQRAAHLILAQVNDNGR